MSDERPRRSPRDARLEPTPLDGGPLDVAELLTQRAWLQRFAAALAGPEGEDLAQETWLRLLTRPMPSLARPRAWLASALRNAARSRARAEERRTRREERAARPEAEPSTDELAARAELEQLAVHAVLELDEPYREALLLRYLRGLEPAEIARRLALPSSTVRNRVARGLELVRARLDARHGERGAWLALVLPPERWTWPSLASGGAAAIAVTTGGAMSAKWILGGAAAVVATGVLWMTRERTERGEPPERTAAAPQGDLRSAAGPPDAASELPRPDDGTETNRESLAEAAFAPDSGATRLVVHVTWARDGSPAAGQPLSVRAWDEEPYATPHAGTTDASGTLEFDGLSPASYHVDTLRGASETVALAPGATGTVELAIPLGTDVHCRVVDPDGAGVAGAEVWFSDYGTDSSGLVLGRTDATGRVRLRDLPADSRRLAARAPGFAPSVQVPIRGAPGASLAVELVLPGLGAELSGVVHDASGTPVALAQVLVGTEFPARARLADGSGTSAAPPLYLLADEQGRFHASGLEPGRVPLQARAPGFGPGQFQVVLAPGVGGRGVLGLRPVALGRGVARDGDGRPLAGVTLTAGATYFDFSGRKASTRADGSYVLRGLGAGDCKIGASSELHGRDRTELLLRRGVEARWDPVLVAGGSLAGTVLDERGGPLESWHVAACAPGETGLWLREAYTGADGRFELVNCPKERFVLAVRAPEEVFGTPVTVVEDFVLGRQDLLIRIDDDDRPTAFLSGRVRAAAGEPLSSAQVVYTALATRMGLAAAPDSDGRFRIGPLRPGEYALAASAQGLGERRVPAFDLAPGEEADVGEIVLERAGHVLARVRAPADSPPPQGLHVELVRDGAHAGSLHFEGLEGRSEPLGRGRYALRTRGRDRYAPEREVEVLPGETTVVELELVPATGRVLEFRLPAGDPSQRLHVIVQDERGEVVSDYDGMRRRGDTFLLGQGGFVRGTYSVRARADSGRSAAGSFSVLDLAPVEEPVVFLLR